MSASRITRNALVLTVALIVACGQEPSPRTQRAFAPPAPSLFGINVTFDDPADMEVMAEELDNLGVEWVRLAVAGEQRNGTLDFTYFDTVVEIFRSRGIEVLGLLGGAEVSCAVETDNFWACPPDPSLEREYARYIEDVVTHFDGAIDYWESWNEPEYDEYWITGSDPRDYARVLRMQYDVIKRVAPDATVLLAATGPTNLPWLTRVLDELGRERAFDAVALHPYRFSAGPLQPQPFFYADGSEAQVDLKTELLTTADLFAQHYGRTEPFDFWITEIGWAGHSRQGGEVLSGVALPSLAQQARWLNQLVGLLRDDEQMHFVKAMFWWNATDLAPGEANVPAHFQYYGLLRSDLRRKPVAQTFSQLSPR